MGRAEFVEKGDDRVKRSFCALLLAGFLILGSVSTVFAAEMRTLSMSELTCEEIDGTKVDVRKMFLTTRATQRIDADIAAGKTVKDVTAYWNTLGVKETIADNPNNPSNADKEEKKDNFDNNTWIINKAISAYEYDRAYMNVYGMTLYFSDTIPE